MNLRSVQGGEPPRFEVVRRDYLERAILGALYRRSCEGQAWPARALDLAGFQHPGALTIFRALRSRYQARGQLDDILLEHELGPYAKAPLVHEYFHDVIAVPGNPENLEAYLDEFERLSRAELVRADLAGLGDQARKGAEPLALLEQARDLLERHAPPRPHICRAPALVDVILERAHEPWVCLGIEGTEVARLRLGSVAMVMGGPGAGKTTLAAQMLAEHAVLHGPAIYLSLELDADELAARIVGMQCNASWEDVLRGRVAERDMRLALDTARLVIVERSQASINELDRIVGELRREFPGQPILAAIDYLQLAAGNTDEMRARMEAVAEELRTTAKRLRIVALGVSQTSRSAGQALRSGELVGIETMTAGAESSAIERSAYVTLAIGAAGEARSDGVAPVELHVGKARFGGGDRVLPMLYNGRSGRWRVAGESKSAVQLATDRVAERHAQEEQRVLEVVRSRATAMVQRDLRESVPGVQKTRVDEAIARLLARGALVQQDEVRIDTMGRRKAFKVLTIPKKEDHA